VPNEKRQRQKQGRAYQRQAALAAQRRGQRRRKTISIVLVLAFVLAGAGGLIGLLIRHDDTESVTSGDKTTSTTAAAATSDQPGSTPCPPASGDVPKKTTFDGPPPQCIDPAKTYTADMVTSQGKMTIALDAKAAPKTVNSFVFLSRYHFFDGLTCHRVITGFVAQCGDPEGTGGGGPGFTLPDEVPKAGAYKVGSLAMANTGQPHSGGSQFFIITGPQGVALPPQYSLFGQVTDGLDSVKALDAVGAPADPGKPKVPVTIQSVTIRET
jgi:cyclophilin family peptidyl-prolyl cis-trans isomerase